MPWPSARSSSIAASTSSMISSSRVATAPSPASFRASPSLIWIPTSRFWAPSWRSRSSRSRSRAPASTMRARESRRSSTSRTRSVMSCTTPIMRSGRSPSSRSKPACEASQITSPSRRMSRRSHDTGSARRYAPPRAASSIRDRRDARTSAGTRRAGARTARHPRPASWRARPRSRRCATRVDLERAELRHRVRPSQETRLVAQLARARKQRSASALLALVDVLDDARVQHVLAAEHGEVDAHPRLRAVRAQIALLVADRRRAGDQRLDRPSADVVIAGDVES